MSFYSVTPDNVLVSLQFRMKCMRLGREAWNGPVSAQKALQGSKAVTRLLLGGTEENSVTSMRGHWLSCQTDQWFFLPLSPLPRIFDCTRPSWFYPIKTLKLRRTWSLMSERELSRNLVMLVFKRKLGNSYLKTWLSNADAKSAKYESTKHEGMKGFFWSMLLASFKLFYVELMFDISSGSAADFFAEHCLSSTLTLLTSSILSYSLYRIFERHYMRLRARRCQSLKMTKVFSMII